MHLSEDIRKVWDTTDSPDVEAWMSTYLGEDDLMYGILDERVMREKVSSMLDNADDFGVDPGTTALIAAKHAAVVAGGDEYLLGALKRQEILLENILRHEYFASLERESKYLPQHLAKNLQRLDKRGGSINQRIASGARNTRVAVAEVFFYDGTSVVFDSLPDSQDVSKRQFEAFEKDGRHRKYAEAVADISQKIECLEKRVAIKQRALQILEETKRDIESREPKSSFPVATVIGKNDTAKNTTPHPEKARTKRRARAIRPDNGPELRPRVVENDAVGTFEKAAKGDIRRLRAFIELAHKGNGKIRILETGRFTGKFTPEWEGIFAALGFRGNLVCVTYENLDTTADYGTPLVVPRLLNTHHNKWDITVFTHVVVTEVGKPLQLLRYIERAAVQAANGDVA